MVILSLGPRCILHHLATATHVFLTTPIAPAWWLRVFDSAITTYLPYHVTNTTIITTVILTIPMLIIVVSNPRVPTQFQRDAGLIVPIVNFRIVSYVAT